jgi:hypothetical protein
MNEITRYESQPVSIPATGRKLPTCREERIGAYCSAIRRLGAFLEEGFKFNTLAAEDGSLVTERKRFSIELKLEDNQAGGRMAYVTSNPDFDPTKEISKTNRPGIVKKGRAWQRSQLHSRDLLRVTVTGTQSLVVYVELRQNIKDPEQHIIKSVMFIIQNASDENSEMNRQLKDTSFLKDVPAEWLPTHDDELQFPEIAGLKTEKPLNDERLLTDPPATLT